MEFEFIDVQSLKKRYIQDELDYIWDYCKKTDFSKYIQTKNDQERLKKCVVYYGFTIVQEAIRKIHKRNLQYPLNSLWYEIQNLTVDKEALNDIPAYRDALTDKYNSKIKEELSEHEFKMLTQNYNKKDNYKSFNNFEERDRSDNNPNGYIGYKEMENKLLGWD